MKTLFSDIYCLVCISYHGKQNLVLQSSVILKYTVTLIKLTAQIVKIQSVVLIPKTLITKWINHELDPIHTEAQFISHPGQDCVESLETDAHLSKDLSTDDANTSHSRHDTFFGQDTDTIVSVHQQKLYQTCTGWNLIIVKGFKRRLKQPPTTQPNPNLSDPGRY